jgi:hypothetical protein
MLGYPFHSRRASVNTLGRKVLRWDNIPYSTLDHDHSPTKTDNGRRGYADEFELSSFRAACLRPCGLESY